MTLFGKHRDHRTVPAMNEKRLDQRVTGCLEQGGSHRLKDMKPRVL